MTTKTEWAVAKAMVIAFGLCPLAFRIGDHVPVARAAIKAYRKAVRKK